jgi:hypothetical protein
MRVLVHVNYVPVPQASEDLEENVCNDAANAVSGPGPTTQRAHSPKLTM